MSCNFMSICHDMRFISGSEGMKSHKWLINGYVTGPNLNWSGREGGGREHILLGSSLRPLSFCTCIVAVSPPPVALSETVTLSDTVTDIPPLSELKMESESEGASNSSYGDKKPIKSTSKDRRSPQQGAKRRSRCQNCAGCLQKEDCGQCTTCK